MVGRQCIVRGQEDAWYSEEKPINSVIAKELVADLLENNLGR